MKLAFSTGGTTPDAPLDPRFGRASAFLVLDLETKEFDLIDNGQSVGAAQGAGIQAAQRLVRADVKGLVTGHCGPKAFQVLNSAGIDVYYSNAGTIREALEDFENGKLSLSSGADVRGHWS
ncbi:NifB/NifX family molybdenum-iron cluster-binding protein [bacterium]|nr:NifB/NifX family molybdenum-iron cluster-binding protein [bacterium]